MTTFTTQTTSATQHRFRNIARAATCLALLGCLLLTSEASAQRPRLIQNSSRKPLTLKPAPKRVGPTVNRLPGLVARPSVQAGGQKPDLIVQDFKRTAAPQFKNGYWEIPVSFKVKNQGNASTSEQFVNGVMHYPNYRWTGFMQPLAPGATRTSTGIVKIPDATKKFAGRTLRLIAHADAPIAAADTSMPAYGRVNESNENNNQATIGVELPGGFGLTGSINQSPTFPGTVKPLQIPQATFVPQNRPATPPARVPAATLPGVFVAPAALAKPDLVIKAMPFVPNQPQVVYVTVQNAGNGPAGLSTLQLTVRKIMDIPVSRQTEVRVPALMPGESKVITVDASKILPTGMPLKHTTFRADADAYKLVAESNETNNTSWYKP